MWSVCGSGVPEISEDLGAFVQGFDERHGAAVREDPGFHLVHDVGETDAAFGVGEGDAATCAGVTECVG